MGPVVEHMVTMEIHRHGRTKKESVSLPLMQILHWVTQERNLRNSLAISGNEEAFSVGWREPRTGEIFLVWIDGGKGGFTMYGQSAVNDGTGFSEWEPLSLYHYLTNLRDRTIDLESSAESLSVRGEFDGVWHPILMSWVPESGEATKWVMYSPHGLTYSQISVPSVRLNTEEGTADASA